MLRLLILAMLLKEQPEGSPVRAQPFYTDNPTEVTIHFAIGVIIASVLAFVILRYGDKEIAMPKFLSKHKSIWIENKWYRLLKEEAAKEKRTTKKQIDYILAERYGK